MRSRQLASTIVEELVTEAREALSHLLDASPVLAVRSASAHPVASASCRARLVGPFGAVDERGRRGPRWRDSGWAQVPRPARRGPKACSRSTPANVGGAVPSTANRYRAVR